MIIDLLNREFPVMKIRIRNVRGIDQMAQKNEGQKKPQNKLSPARQIIDPYILINSSLQKIE